MKKDFFMSKLTGGRLAYGKSRDERVLLNCTVLKDRFGKIVQVESIQDVIPLEPLDVPVRVLELAKLENGWLDGEGVAPSPEGLRWFSETFDRNYAPDLQLPYLYPTPEGNVQAEWSLDGWSASVLFDLATHKAEFEAFQPATDESREMRFDLSTADGWIALNDSLRFLVAGTVKT